MPADHPDKGKEGGSQSTPGEFIDWLLDVAEACDRVLAPHGSLCIELGDTYAGGGTGLANYSDDRGNPDGMRDTTFSGGNTKTGGGTGWPLAKSLSLIPESFRFAMVYGFNPHTGRRTDPWRLRNVVRWVRPNPPVGALGDKFRPATSELMVFCKSAKRYFDLDAVREPHTVSNMGPVRSRAEGTKGALHHGTDTGKTWEVGERMNLNPAGAPPLDWWNIPLLEGEEETRYGPKNDHDTTRHLRATKKLEPGGLMTDHPRNAPDHPLGAPPLDWWEIPPGGYEGAHYAVFPPELCVKPVKAMCPVKVCRQCGEPSRRIVEKRIPVDQSEKYDRQPNLAAHIRERREALGFSPEEVNGWFGFVAGVKHWEAIGRANGQVPTPAVWPVLKERLGLSDDFDDLVYGDRKWANSDIERATYIQPNGAVVPEGGWRSSEHHRTEGGWKAKGRNNGMIGGVRESDPTLGFSDCGHNDWRPGLILDCFGGSGTTALVATGHGRDCILIDLDERNYDLALERVGPFILTRGEDD